jgi:ZIP family zinc transporter
MDRFLLGFLLVVGAGLSTGIGSAVVYHSKLVVLASKNVLGVSLGLSTGVMMYVSFIEIFPKAILAFTEAGNESSMAYLYSTICFFGGVVLIRLIDMLVHWLSPSDLVLHALDVENLSEMLEETEEMESKWNLAGGGGNDGDDAEDIAMVGLEEGNANGNASKGGGTNKMRLSELPEADTASTSKLLAAAGGDSATPPAISSSSNSSSSGRRRSNSNSSSNSTKPSSPRQASSSPERKDNNNTLTDSNEGSIVGGGGQGEGLIAGGADKQQHDHHNHGDSCDHEHEGGITVEDLDLKRMGLFTAAAIAIHNFPEGLATFVATLDDPTVGVGLAVAIAIHNIPEGLCVSMPIYFATGNRHQAFMWGLLSGMSEIVAAGLGWLILANAFDGNTFGILFSLVAGMMVSICMYELLPTARKYDPTDQFVTHSVVVGMLFMSASLVAFQL